MKNTDTGQPWTHHDAPPPDKETLDRLHISATLGQVYKLNIKPEDVEERRGEILDLLKREGTKNIPENPDLGFISKALDDLGWYERISWGS